ncbi:MAG: hypothetical protein RI885_2501 [Actinomycetota bacterium]|jgi:hypothetical protein
MGLSRKRAKELKKLKKAANELWEEQREVVGHASGVVREAGRQIGNAGREEVVPRVRDTVDNRIRPAVNSGLSAARSTVNDARYKVSHDLLPGASAAVASALATLDASSDPRVREVLKQVHKKTDQFGKNASKAGKKASKAYGQASKQAGKAYSKYGSRVGLVKPKPAIGAGGVVLIVLGVVAVVGIAYAAWQTLRADDELWVVDETDDGDVK